MLSFLRSRFTWLAYFLLAYYGFCLNILGPITPFLMDELGLSYTLASLHFTAFAAGILLVGLFGHQLIERLGNIRALWIASIGLSLGSLVLILGHSPWVTITACFLMGWIGSLILAIVPSALSEQHGEHRAIALSEANVLASLVSAFAPILVGWFAQSDQGWRLSLALASLAPVGLFLGFRRAVPATVARDKDVLDQHKLPLKFWLYWVALMLAVSIEFCMIFWSADFLEKILGLAQADAAQAVSLFLGGMILGRLVGSRLVRCIQTSKVVYLALFIAAGGFLMYWLPRAAPLGLAGLFLSGLGVASLYPLILSLAIGSAPQAAGQASARATLASGVAILSLPLVLGRLADAAGIWFAYGLILLLLAGVLAFVQLAGRPSAVLQT